MRKTSLRAKSCMPIGQRLHAICSLREKFQLRSRLAPDLVADTILRLYDYILISPMFITACKLLPNLDNSRRQQLPINATLRSGIFPNAVSLYLKLDRSISVCLSITVKPDQPTRRSGTFRNRTFSF